MDRDGLLKALVEIVGPDRVLSEERDLTPYASDMTECAASMPGAVVRPVTGEEVRSVILLANRALCPITPAVARTNLAGLTIPPPGGIMIDLSQMNRILEVNEEDQYAVVEPGVTFGQMRAHLDAHHPRLRMGYPLSPPETSVLCNCLLDGLGNFSLRHGSMADWITSLEAVLPTGEVIRGGSAALTPHWFGKMPVPDVTGLFVSWQGTTGIVTKLGVQLWPERGHRRRGFVMCTHSVTGVAMMKELARTDLFDDIGGLSWPASKMLLGVAIPEKHPDEPEFMVYLDWSSDSKALLRAKTAEVNRLLRGMRKAGMEFEDFIPVDDLIRMSPTFASLSEFPTRLGFLLDGPGGGLTWVGTYGPLSKAVEGLRGASRIVEEAGRVPIVVARPMKGGHFGVLRFITVFNKEDPDEVERVRTLNRTLARFLLDVGFIPYKSPRWVVDMFMERIDPGYAALIQRIKDLLDPNHIMNPGKWV